MRGEERSGAQSLPMNPQPQTFRLVRRGCLIQGLSQRSMNRQRRTKKRHSELSQVHQPHRPISATASKTHRTTSTQQCTRRLMTPRKNLQISSHRRLAVRQPRLSKKYRSPTWNCTILPTLCAQSNRKLTESRRWSSRSHSGIETGSKGADSRTPSTRKHGTRNTLRVTNLPTSPSAEGSISDRWTRTPTWGQVYLTLNGHPTSTYSLSTSRCSVGTQAHAATTLSRDRRAASRSESGNGREVSP